MHVLWCAVNKNPRIIRASPIQPYMIHDSVFLEKAGTQVLCTVYYILHEVIVFKPVVRCSP